MASQSLNKLANGSISVIAIARILAGSTTLFMPQLGAQLFGLPLAHESNVIARLFGVRDLVLGVFLWSARGNISRAITNADIGKAVEAKRDVRNVLWMGLLVDSVDVCSSVVAVLQEGMQGKAIPLVGGGAALFAVLAGASLKRM